MTEPAPLVPIPEVAARLGMTVRRVRRLIRDECIPVADEAARNRLVNVALVEKQLAEHGHLPRLWWVTPQ